MEQYLKVTRENRVDVAREWLEHEISDLEMLRHSLMDGEEPWQYEEERKQIDTLKSKLSFVLDILSYDGNCPKHIVAR